MAEFFSKIYEKALEVLAVIIIIAGIVAGIIIGKGLSSYQNEILYIVLGFIIGGAAGFLFDAIVLGFLFQISAIRSNTESILYYSSVIAKLSQNNSFPSGTNNEIPTSASLLNNETPSSTTILRDSSLNTSGSNKWTCKKCGQENDSNLDYCSSCGQYK